MVRRKVSLDGESEGRASGGAAVDAAPSTEVVELFFNGGIVFHEVAFPAGLPDVVAGFVRMQAPQTTPGTEAWSIRKAQPGEDPDVEMSSHDALSDLQARWLPVPTQLSCPFAVQIFLSQKGSSVRGLLAVNTLERQGSRRRALDATLDEGRPFRPLDRTEIAGFLDLPEARDFVRRLERTGIDKPLFKLAALLDVLAPRLPKLHFTSVSNRVPLPVSLVLDFGNSRSSALLVEARDRGMFALPLVMRNLGSPFSVDEECFDSRVTFLPSPFDRAVSTVATGDGFGWPSIARLGREALDRALETPHRYACSISGPKRYLWDHRPTEDLWFFADRKGDEYRTIFGKLLKYIPEESGGLYLREDGPQTPVDPRYAPRTMMLFAIVEILCQAYAQVGSPGYRKFQGKEANPRVLRSLVLTYPSTMRKEERSVYDTLVRNAVILACHLLGIPPEHRPNVTAEGAFEPFLFTDEALAAQMVYVYQEATQTFSGSTEELVQIYGRKAGHLRIASIDIGGGTSDVMVAEYEDKLPGAGTALRITKLFQDGINVAGDEICRAIVADVIFDQVLAQLPSHDARAKMVHLFGEGDAGHGSSWKTLRGKLVPYLWMPLARCLWALAEGRTPEGFSAERAYFVPEVLEAFGMPAPSPFVLAEADAFLGKTVPGFPGLTNLFLRLDRDVVEKTIVRVLREPMRRYADILAQFDVDLVVLAGRSARLACVRDLFVAEMPVSPPRIKTMASFRVGEWYPSKWKDQGTIKDPKSTVAAGAAILHLASRNMLPGFLIDTIEDAKETPIFGLYQDNEPHIAKENELFPEGSQTGQKARSKAFAYTNGMRIGFRNVASQEMDGIPIFEVRPQSPEVEAALLEDRVLLEFSRGDAGQITIAKVTSQRGAYAFEPTDFYLALKTIAQDRYWTDTGVFADRARYT